MKTAEDLIANLNETKAILEKMSDNEIEKFVAKVSSHPSQPAWEILHLDAIKFGCDAYHGHRRR